ncbi:MAG: hypothetical protein AB8H03_25630 [Saprospiraceae bacterium]
MRNSGQCRSSLFNYMEPYHNYRRIEFFQFLSVTGFTELLLRIPVSTSDRNINPNIPASQGLLLQLGGIDWKRIFNPILVSKNPQLS